MRAVTSIVCATLVVAVTTPGWAQAPRPAPQQLQRPIQQPLPTQPLGPSGPPRAMVIVVEENDQQTFSTSWGRLSAALFAARWDEVIPPEQRQVVGPIVQALQDVARPFNIPVSRFLDRLTLEARRQFAPMLARMLGQIETQLQLPEAGCLRNVLQTLAQRGMTTGEDPFKAFVNAYGEPGLAGCLRSMAQPYYNRVEVLTDSQATYAVFRDRLRALHGQGYVIDTVIDLHGCGTPQGATSAYRSKECGAQRLVFADGSATEAHVRAIRATVMPSTVRQQAPATRTRLPAGAVQAASPPLNLNAVYTVSCWGSTFNDGWQHVGARAANGARELNYFVLLSPLIFMDQFTRGGLTLKDAAQRAYDAERLLYQGVSFPINFDLRPSIEAFLAGLPLDAGGRNAARGTIGLACPGGQYANCRVAFNVGTQYAGIVNDLLGRVYGHNGQRVNPAGSSQRIHSGDPAVRRAGQ